VGWIGKKVLQVGAVGEWVGLGGGVVVCSGGGSS